MAPDIYKRFKAIEEAYKKSKDDLDKVTKSIAFLMNKKEMAGDEKKAMLNKLITTKTTVMAQYKEIQSEYKMLNEKLHGANEGIIKVKKKLYPGVKVTIGSVVKYISEDYSFCTLQSDKVDILITPY